MASIDESYADDNSDEGSISTNALEDIQDGSHVHPDINTRDARLKISDRIKQAQSECKGEEISSNMMGKVLHKLLKAVLNELNNSWPKWG